MTDLRSMALSLPNVEQGLACAGTALESHTCRIGNKTFLFVSKKEARLKLDSSAPEAKGLGFKVGAGGWVTLPLDGLPAAHIARRWIAESYAQIRGPIAVKKRAATKAAAPKKRR
jgi:hypothetical protein